MVVKLDIKDRYFNIIVLKILLIVCSLHKSEYLVSNMGINSANENTTGTYYPLITEV